MYENTIIVFTSDHGDLLGSHSYLHQKFFCAYEEVTRVPMMIHSPLFGSKHRDVHTLTSHIDLLPTLLSLSGLSDRKISKLRTTLSKTFSLALPLPGKSFAKLAIDGECKSEKADKLIYFYTYDESISDTYLTPICTKADQVPQPCNLDMIVYQDEKGALWKLTRYFNKNSECPNFYVGHILYELYNLNKDPLELTNLSLDDKYKEVFDYLLKLLTNQSVLHRYTPGH
jgi:arylsulfatase A-like enzyme